MMRTKKPIKHLERKLHWSRRLTLFSYYSTLLLFSGGLFLAHSWRTPFAWLLLVFQLLPLLLLMPGLLKGWAKNQVWLCFTVLFYFCFAVMAGEKPGWVGIISIAEALMIAILFVSAMLYSRWQGRQNWLINNLGEATPSTSSLQA